MTRVFRYPGLIAAIVALIALAALAIESRAPPSRAPPGTSFQAAREAGATIQPTRPEPAIRPEPAGPQPVAPADPSLKARPSRDG